MRIIETAAKIIVSDIKGMKTDKTSYPAADDISNVVKNFEFTPTSVSLFISELLKGLKNVELKTAAIGQALVQAVRPKSLVAPIQIGLGVAIHHLIGSRQVIDLLHRLEFSSSYNEVKVFELSADKNSWD